MPALRILLVGMSTMFSDIVVQALAAHASVEVVAQLQHGERVDVKSERSAPGLVLRGLRPGECETAIGAELLKCFPTATVIMFSTDSRHAFVHRVQAARVPLNDVTLDRFIHAVLSNIAPRNGVDVPP
ncbi:MAG: response regulator transcription factor [Alphaproteobacteria bacterium]|nr:response regulator transcription factor [Alphaproteobacteria bacterium]